MTSVRDQVEAFKTDLMRWQARIGVPAEPADLKESEAILTMSRGRLEAMSASEAANAAFVLSQLAFELQRRENGLNAFAGWCAANRNRFPAECKSMIIDLRESSEQRRMSIAYLARRVEFMSQCLMAVQRSRQKETT